MFAVYWPYSWSWHKAKKQFLDQIWWFFYNESKILTILFIVKYEKITLFDEFLVFLGPIISSFFACSNEEKNKQKQQRVLDLVLSLWNKISIKVNALMLTPHLFHHISSWIFGRAASIIRISYFVGFPSSVHFNIPSLQFMFSCGYKGAFTLSTFAAFLPHKNARSLSLSSLSFVMI